MLHPKFLDAPTLAEKFALAFTRAGWREDYAKKHKPAAGQGGLFDWKEEDHPRDEGGRFSEAQKAVAAKAHAIIMRQPHSAGLRPDQVEERGKNLYFNYEEGRKAFPQQGHTHGHKLMGQAIREHHEALLKAGGGVQQAASAPGQKGLFGDDAIKPAAAPPPAKPGGLFGEPPPSKKAVQTALFGGLKNQKGQEDLFNRDYRDEPEPPKAEEPKAEEPKAEEPKADHFNTGRGATYKPNPRGLKGFISQDFAYTILNDVPLDSGDTLVESKIIERQIPKYHSLFRVSVIRNKDGDLYTRVENGSDAQGDLGGAQTRFHPVPTEALEDNRALKGIDAIALKLYESAKSTDSLTPRPPKAAEQAKPAEPAKAPTEDRAAILAKAASLRGGKPPFKPATASTR